MDNQKSSPTRRRIFVLFVFFVVENARVDARGPSEGATDNLASVRECARKTVCVVRVVCGLEKRI